MHINNEYKYIKTYCWKQKISRYYPCFANAEYIVASLKPYCRVCVDVHYSPIF